MCLSSRVAEGVGGTPSEADVTADLETGHITATLRTEHTEASDTCPEADRERPPGQSSFSRGQP